MGKGSYETYLMKDNNFSYTKVKVTSEDPDYWYTEDRQSYSKKEYRSFSTKEEAEAESARRMAGN